MNDEKPPSNSPQPDASSRQVAEPARTPIPAFGTRSFLSRFLLLLLAGLLIYFIAYVPVKLQVRQLIRERDAARNAIRLKETQIALASATVDARRGEYEAGRQEAAEFFTFVSNELLKANESAFDAEDHAALEKLLSERDDLITLLARADPAAAERLSNLYLSFRQIISQGTSGPR